MVIVCPTHVLRHFKVNQCLIKLFREVDAMHKRRTARLIEAHKCDYYPHSRDGWIGPADRLIVAHNKIPPRQYILCIGYIFKHEQGIEENEF